MAQFHSVPRAQSGDLGRYLFFSAVAEPSQGQRTDTGGLTGLGIRLEGNRAQTQAHPTP